MYIRNIIFFVFDKYVIMYNIIKNYNDDGDQNLKGLIYTYEYFLH